MTIMSMNESTNECRDLVLYTPKPPKTVRKKQRTTSSTSLGGWMFKVHLQAYRAVCNKITDAGLYVINKVVRPETTFEDYDEFGTYLRKFAPIDYTYVTCRRAANKVMRTVGEVDLFDEEELKTNNQRQKEREIKEMNLELGELSAYSRFCADTAKLVDDLFPKLVCAQMIGLPSLGEQCLLYQLWLPYRYINYQVNRRTNYRNQALESGIFKTMTRWYWFMTTNFTHSLLCKDNVSPILNFEHVLLKICMKLKPKIEGGEQGKSINDVILDSVATSIQRLQECDDYMSHLDFDSKREAFIERLEWYRKNDYLPPGLPDPSGNRLNISNLEDELDKAMYEYLDEISTTILDELAPKKFKNQFVHFVYWLEGKHGLVKLLSYLIGELGVKQVSDPHLFALAILTALGIEVADFETDGFGRGKMETIFKAGEKMIKHSLEEGVSSSVVVEDFLNTGLKHNPQSVEGIKQKKEAREELERVICDLLYDGIKPESYRYTGGLKDIRKFMQNIPVLGMATVIMNAMYSTLHLSISYYFRAKEQYSDSLPIFMLKSMWGKDYTKKLTKKTMELIYHPAWRFAALQLIHDVTNHIFNKGEEVHQLNKKPSTNENIRSIASFVINHYTADVTSVPVEPLFNFLLSDEMINKLKETLSSPGKPFLETAMESILPTINEITLYLRVGEAFRKENIYFEGDSKFWELFIREYLNRAIYFKIRERYSSPEKPPQEAINAIRDELVQEMLEMDMLEIKKKLMSLPKKIDEHPKPTITIEQELNDGMLIWDYGQFKSSGGSDSDKSEGSSLSDDFVLVDGDDEDPFK